MSYDIDIVTQYCVFCDYPLFRYNIEKYRDFFKKVILYPSRHHGVIDLEEWSRKYFHNTTWVNRHTIDWTTPGIDWRQVETEPCLALSDADWVLFLEQDFFVDNWEAFLDKVKKSMRGSDAIGWKVSTAYPYLHPSFFLIKRELLEKTRKDFRAHPEIYGSDHFAQITRDIETLNAKITTVQGLGYENWESAFHLGGLTYVYQDWKDNGESVDRTANTEALYVCNYWATQAPVWQNDLFIELSKKVGKVLESRFPLVNPEDSKWTKFFNLWSQ